MQHAISSFVWENGEDAHIHSERKKDILLHFAGILFVQKLNHRNISSVKV